MLIDALTAGKVATKANQVNRIDLDVRYRHPLLISFSFLSFKFTSPRSVASARLTGHGCVAATLLLAEEFEKQNDGFTFGFEMVAHRLPARSDTTPTSHQASFPEQVWLDGHSIEAGHVFREVYPLDIKVIGLSDHADMIVFLESTVQQEF